MRRSAAKKTPDPKGLEAISGFEKMGAEDGCDRIGKVFTGDVDCDDGHNRVKCK